MAKNVLGDDLVICGCSPMTGFTRTGSCETGPQDRGSHTICAVVTAEFLVFSAARGNDLTTPRPGFPGLVPGDHWCLCAARWEEARRADTAPPVILGACHEAALGTVELDALLAHAAEQLTDER